MYPETQVKVHKWRWLWWILGLLLFVGMVVGATVITWMALNQKGPPLSNALATSTPLGTLSQISGLNDSPPAYVKNVVATKEGYQAFIAYFTLADANGSFTTADGKAKFEVFGDKNERLMSVEVPVHKTDFVKTTVGMGAFAHEVVLCNFGRIPYSAFSRMPDSFSGKIKVTFTIPTGESFVGQDTILFDKP